MIDLPSAFSVCALWAEGDQASLLRLKNATTQTVMRHPKCLPIRMPAWTPLAKDLRSVWINARVECLRVAVLGMLWRRCFPIMHESQLGLVES